QAVTPFQRGAQRLMPAQHDARARSEYVEALVEARTQTFDAEKRQARRRELDREWDAIESTANLDGSRSIRGCQREIRIGPLRARGEALDPACLRRVRRAVVHGHRESAHAVYVFFRGLQRLLAGGQNAH